MPSFLDGMFVYSEYDACLKHSKMQEHLKENGSGVSIDGGLAQQYNNWVLDNKDYFQQIDPR